MANDLNCLQENYENVHIPESIKSDDDLALLSALFIVTPKFSHKCVSHLVMTSGKRIYCKLCSGK